jgi:hypothetical protein
VRKLFVIALGLAVTVVTATAAMAGDGPPGFWYGTDSWPTPVTGHGPYAEPVIGGSYGGYIGMGGNWDHWLGCSTGNFIAWSSANAAQASTDFTKYHLGVGTGVYWYMGGPGVDPHYNGSSSEAYSWGAQQAARALYDAKIAHVNYPVIWADIELPGIAPAPDNGWDSVYTSPCSGVVKQSFVPTVLDRGDYNGFYDYIKSHSSYQVGVYSSAPVWTRIFTNGSISLIPHSYEWTYWPETSSLSHAPNGWCLRGSSSCAQFFGGQTSNSPTALAWQWSGGGGVTNGVGDFDQIDASRLG